MAGGSVLRIIRPVNCGMIGLAVLVGEFVSKPPGVPFLASVLGFLTGFFICAYSMVVNDVYDVEVDRVNQPGRPIPSGKISVAGATRLSVLLLVVGMAFAALSLDPAAVAIAAAYAFLSWLYNWWAKKSGLAGNLVVASSLAIPFIYGGVISGGSVFSSLLLAMAFTSFFAGVGREVVKAIADVEGDSKRGVGSLARSRGARPAGAVGAAFFLLAVVTSWLPLFLALANPIYLVGVWVPDAVFVYLAISILRNSGAENAHRVKNAALVGMLVGLVVFIGGGL
ncbi:MAG: geranylgeranylglycerol-phosphate geranylgeranyltransferase [Nitrososphaerota archaeon]|nr:geranylgeranylglycerol-phosphate geranylgeranyltransferase [Nitrososphaerota archaeon]